MRWYGTPPSALPSRKCPKPAAPDAAPLVRALAAMLKAHCAAKTADAFNTEDLPGDMAADESYESGE